MNNCIICRRHIKQDKETCACCKETHHPIDNEDKRVIFMKETFDKLSKAGTLLNRAGHYPEIERNIMRALTELAHEILLLEH